MFELKPSIISRHPTNQKVHLKKKLDSNKVTFDKTSSIWKDVALTYTFVHGEA